MTTTTNVKQVKLNIMTQSQYNSATKNANELYMLTDATVLASEVSGLSAVATSGSYNDLSNTPTIPTVNNPTITITQGGVTKGSFTLNQSSGDTIALDAGGGGGSYTAGDGIDITSNVISNTGVRSVSAGTNNGTISVDTNGTSAEVSVAGLGSAAFKSMTSTYDSTGTDPVDGVAVASAISDRADTSLSNLQDGGTRKTVRTGMIIPYDGSTAPSGWRKCNGNAISRTTYADLFAVIGTTYGAGDGSTTFNVPTQNDCTTGYPSTSYSSVTVGSSGTAYTASKNGWYAFYGQATADGQYIVIKATSSSGVRLYQVHALSGQWIALSCPVKKGNKISIQYNIGSSTTLHFHEDVGHPSIIKT